jgi:hypothetical protein
MIQGDIKLPALASNLTDQSKFFPTPGIASLEK